MKNIKGYSDFINESVNIYEEFKDRPEIVDFIEVLKERTYDFVDDGYDVFVYVMRKLGGVNEGMFTRVFHYFIKGGQDDVLSFEYSSGRRVDIPELEKLVFDIDIRDNWGVSIPSSDPRMMELHEILHYEFPKIKVV